MTNFWAAALAWLRCTVGSALLAGSSVKAKVLAAGSAGAALATT